MFTKGESPPASRNLSFTMPKPNSCSDSTVLDAGSVCPWVTQQYWFGFLPAWAFLKKHPNESTGAQSCSARFRLAMAGGLIADLKACCCQTAPPKLSQNWKQQSQCLYPSALVLDLVLAALNLAPLKQSCCCFLEKDALPWLGMRSRPVQTTPSG